MRRLFWLILLALISVATFFTHIYVKNSRAILFNPLAEIPMSTPTPTEIIIVTPTSTPSAVLNQTDIAAPSPTIKKITPTITPTPTAVDSEVIYKMIDKYASMGGIDPNVVRYMAICESGFRSNAINGIYVGLFQFAPQSWKNLRIEMGKDSDINLRFSPDESIQTVVYALSKGKEKMWPNCLPK